ncbi:MAG: nitroreductase family protein [Candidatus Brocadiia bacterium]
MSDVLEFIQKRRSIRAYKKDAPVSEAQVETLLRAAMAAPSAGGEQAWAFVVIRERKTLDQVTEIHPYASMLEAAPLAILVCGDLEREKHKHMWVQDCAAATQNLLLAAANIGLGTCWCGVHPQPEREEGLRRLCDLPKHIVPFAIVAVGVPDEQKGPADYYDPERVHDERW